MKIYAYVTSECCAMTRVFLPGEEVDNKRVHRHGDYYPWTHGKRETLAIRQSEGAQNAYMRRCARAVADLKGWAR